MIKKKCLLEGLDEEQRQLPPRLKIQLDRTGTQHHEIDGIGLHLPRITLSARGTALGLCQRRHRSMADCGNPIDILMSRSEDGGKTWQASAPFPAKGTGEATLAELSDGRIYYCLLYTSPSPRD